MIAVRFSTVMMFFTTAFLSSTGCGDKGQSLYRVSGSVKFLGKPVAAGWVNCTPDPSKGNSGPEGRAYIQEGTFNTSGVNGRATPGGELIVRIQGFDGQKTEESPEGKSLFAPYQMTISLPREDSTI